jgi:hypothetical protein
VTTPIERTTTRAASLVLRVEVAGQGSDFSASLSDNLPNGRCLHIVPMYRVDILSEHFTVLTASWQSRGAHG